MKCTAVSIVISASQAQRKNGLKIGKAHENESGKPKRNDAAAASDANDNGPSFSMHNLHISRLCRDMLLARVSRSVG
jgi:hypothetical protein